MGRQTETAPTLSRAKSRLLERLKRLGPTTASELAESLGLTDVAVRQHLQALDESGLVRNVKQPPRGRGRPSGKWSLTALADSVFPDRHGDLTLSLIGALRHEFGEAGMARLLAARGRNQVAEYRNRLPSPKASLQSRVEALARCRTAEGYMAEVVREKRGTYLLVEHHCPICEAAKSCTGLCVSELEVFEEALGDGTSVERTEHLLSGGTRCVYRIKKKK